MQKPLSVVSTSLSSCRTLSRERSAPRRAFTDGYRKTKEKGARRPSFFALSYILRARFLLCLKMSAKCPTIKKDSAVLFVSRTCVVGGELAAALSDPLSCARVVGVKSVKTLL